MRPRLISMWSGPRNVSTAMMYSWRQRADTEVVDEPWYARYLATTGIPHPGAAEVIASQPTEPAEITARMQAPSERPVRFFKNMAHHLESVDPAVLDLTDNYLLVRDPRDMLPSLAASLGRVPTMDQTGLEHQTAIFTRMERAGSPPPVVVARALQDDPRRVLQALCEALGLVFDEAVLSWPAGPKPEDGVWAPYWYDSVHASTEFGPYQPKAGPIEDELAPLLDRCRPIYERLVATAL